MRIGGEVEREEGLTIGWGEGKASAEEREKANDEKEER
jgi:hypothetical protein